LQACAPIPVATNPRYDTQEKIRSVSHWKIIADKTTESLPGAALPAGVLFVKSGAAETPFDEAFQSYLTTALTHKCLVGHTCTVAQGHVILNPELRVAADRSHLPIQDSMVPSAQGAGYIAYGVERVRHRDAASSRPPLGTFTLLGTGVWLTHQVTRHWSSSSRYVAAIPAGALADLLTATVTRPTHTEIIVSLASVDANGVVQFRADKSFYVEDADADEYPNEPLRLAYGKPVVIPWNPIDIKR
jgi:hypothetical protein